VMKGDRQGHGVRAPHKLRQFLTNLAAILIGPSNLAAIFTGPSDTGRATKKQIQQLGGGIMDHGRMVSQFYSHQPVGVEVKELAFRFRETTHNIVTALVLLEKEGWASRTRLARYWTLRVSPQNNKECSPAMKNNEESKHEEQLPHSNNLSRKKHYEAPKITILERDQAKAQLVARALAGDRDAQDLAELVSKTNLNVARK